MTATAKNKTVTKRDVAKAANVSHMTVSRVLAGSTNVSDETRQKVMKVCKELNYRRNILASSLSIRKTNTIGLVVPNIKHNFYARLVHGIEQACAMNSYHMIMAQGHGHSDNTMDWKDFEFLLARQIDGILMNYPCNEEIVSRLEKEDVPVVFIDHPAKNSKFSFIATDDYQGSRILAQYLVDKGHRNIAYIAGNRSVQNSLRRLQGYKDALKENSIPVCEELISEQNFNMSGGFKGIQELQGRGVSFTALMACNDYLAVGAIRALYASGLKVPDDVSIVGFAGDEIGDYCQPPLTTMLQPAEEMGARAVNMLLEQVEGLSSFDQEVLIKTKLIERESVKNLP